VEEREEHRLPEREEGRERKRKARIIKQKNKVAQKKKSASPLIKQRNILKKEPLVSGKKGKKKRLGQGLLPGVLKKQESEQDTGRSGEKKRYASRCAEERKKKRTHKGKEVTFKPIWTNIKIGSQLMKSRGERDTISYRGGKEGEGKTRQQSSQL